MLLSGMGLGLRPRVCLARDCGVTINDFWIEILPRHCAARPPKTNPWQAAGLPNPGRAPP